MKLLCDWNLTISNGGEVVVNWRQGRHCVVSVRSALCCFVLIKVECWDFRQTCWTLKTCLVLCPERRWIINKIGAQTREGSLKTFRRVGGSRMNEADAGMGRKSALKTTKSDGRREPRVPDPVRAWHVLTCRTWKWTPVWFENDMQLFLHCSTC